MRSSSSPFRVRMCPPRYALSIEGTEWLKSRVREGIVRRKDVFLSLLAVNRLFQRGLYDRRKPIISRKMRMRARRQSTHIYSLERTLKSLGIDADVIVSLTPPGVIIRPEGGKSMTSLPGKGMWTLIDKVRDGRGRKYRISGEGLKWLKERVENATQRNKELVLSLKGAATLFGVTVTVPKQRGRRSRHNISLTRLLREHGLKYSVVFTKNFNGLRVFPSGNLS